MGYSSQSKGYKLWDVQSKKFVVSRDVHFVEEQDQSTAQGELTTKSRATVYTDDDDSSNESSSEDDSPDAADVSDEDFEDAHEDHASKHIATATEPPQPVTLRRSNRERKPPGEWYKAPPSPSSQAHETGLLAADVPGSYTEATSPNNIDFWAPGIEKEHNALLENKAFVLVERQQGMNVIPCRYVFRVKGDQPKVRLVAKGFRQVHGVDYFETYAPVVSLAAVRCFLALVAHFDLECDQMDVVTAFLNGELDEDIYMEVPAGFKDPNRPHLVCKLQKALYGLKQAPKQWYAKINNFLVHNLNFTSSPYEPCLYTLNDKGSMALIVLYVDDLLVAGSSRTTVDRIKDEFKSRYKMKDLGEASEFLSISINRNRSKRTLHITQTCYTDKILERFNMVDANPTCTPMEVNSPHLESSDLDPEQPAHDVPYRQAIGCLMYLMIGTRPDIGYAVGKLSQYCEKPTKSNWSSVKRVLRYLKGTRNIGITFRGNSNVQPVGYCDSDWAGCRETRKSTEGMVFLLAGGAVHWRSKKQSIVATSTCEAEYIAAYSATKEAIWLSRLFASMLSQASSTPITVRIDNHGTVQMAHNVSINARNKHIDIRYHFVREAVGTKLVVLEHCSHTEQVADTLTKPLPRIKFVECREKMGLEELSVAKS